VTGVDLDEVDGTRAPDIVMSVRSPE